MSSPGPSSTRESINGRDEASQLYFLYMWTKTPRVGPHNEWSPVLVEKRSARNPVEHPALARWVSDFPQTDACKLSCVSFGPSRGSTPSTFFLRTTDENGVWDYRWAGLSESCEMAVQRSFRCPDPRTSYHGQGLPRLRAVEFGYDKSWVVYGSDSNYAWELSKSHYDGQLEDALLFGQSRGLTINVSLRPIDAYN